MTRSSWRGVVPPLTDPDEVRAHEEVNAKILSEAFFDEMMMRCNSSSIPAAFEPMLVEMFQAMRAVVWLEQSAVSGLYAPTIDKLVNGRDSVVAATAIAKTVINCVTIDDESAADAIGCETGAPQLLFPLLLRGGDVVGVCQISREPAGAPFNELEVEQARYLMNKFAIYGTCMLSPAKTIFDACSLAQIDERKQVIDRLVASLKGMFHCESVDFWIFREKTNTFARYEESENAFLVRLPTEVGIVGWALRARQFINEKWRKYHVNYDENIDGDANSPILVGSEELQEHVYAIALRGKTEGDEFSVDDDKRIQIVMPFVARSLAFSFKYAKREVPQQVSNEFRLAQLLDGAASITHVMDLSTLVRKIEEDGKVIGSAGVCRLWLVDPVKNAFVGYPDEHEVSLDDGIIGEVYRTQDTYKADDALKDEHFDQEADIGSDEDIRSVLAVPVFSAFDKVVAVIVVANKTNNGKFSVPDENQMSAYGVFCGVALQSAMAYHRIKMMPSHQLRFVQQLPSDINYDTVEAMMRDLLTQARQAIRAVGATLFLENDGELFEFVSVGDNRVSLTSDYVKSAFLEKEISLFGVNGTYANKVDHSNADGACSIICCSPLFSSDKVALGLLQFGCGLLVTPGDLDIIQAFVRLAAASLEKAQLKRISELGKARLQVNTSMAQEELDSSEIPEGFKLQEVPTNLLECDESALVKVVFHVFNMFKLQTRFSIRNQTLLSFITQASTKYRDLPHWNWRHAVSTCWFSGQLVGGLKETIPSTEILVLLAAALCHDVDHDGFQSILGSSTSLPFSILFKNQSYYESHHCKVAIDILSQDESNIFRHVSDSGRVWKDFVGLILATDMSRHFELMNQIRSLNTDLTNEPVRELALKLIIKAADVSACCQPFDVADRLKAFVAEEFFQTGDLESVAGLAFTGDARDRQHVAKEESLVPFYKLVCSPIFTALARFVPSASDLAQQLQDNIERWSGGGASS